MSDAVMVRIVYFPGAATYCKTHGFLSAKNDENFDSSRKALEHLSENSARLNCCSVVVGCKTSGASRVFRDRRDTRLRAEARSPR